MEFETMYNELQKAVAGILEKFSKPGLAEFSAHVETVTSENERLKTENVALQTKCATFETEKRALEFSAFVEGLVLEGRVLPDQKAAKVAMLETMHAATPIEFSAENGAKSPLEQYKDELRALPIVAPKTGESSGPEFAAASGDGEDIGQAMIRYTDEQKAKGVFVDVFQARRAIIGK